MPLGVVGTPAAILVLTLLVPFAYCYTWPGGLARPSIFLVVTLTLALIVAAISIFWFPQALVGVGISGASASTDAGSALFEARLRTRFIIAALVTVLVQYLICRATQTLLGR